MVGRNDGHWDLTTVGESGRPWDFSKEEMRQNALQKIKSGQTNVDCGIPIVHNLFYNGEFESGPGGRSAEEEQSG